LYHHYLTDAAGGGGKGGGNDREVRGGGAARGDGEGTYTCIYMCTCIMFVLNMYYVYIICMLCLLSSSYIR
jgi:hypothetical protein